MAGIMSPRRGGESDKFGNRYEGAWTVRHVLHVLAGSGWSLTVEDVGDLAKGVEFTYRRAGAVEVHQVKRQNGVANGWTVRSLLGMGIWDNARHHVRAGREFHLVSSVPARVAQELCDNARSASDPRSFVDHWLPNQDLQEAFSELATVNNLGALEPAWRVLRGTWIECHGERDVAELNGLLAGQLLDGAAGALAAVGIGDLVVQHLGVELTAPLIEDRLRKYGLRRAPMLLKETIERRTWRVVAVADCPPEQVGVHPAASGANQHGQPPYVTREHDHLLRAQLRRVAVNGGMVVVVGGSSTGKSRSLLEAVRAELADWRLLLPDDAEAVRRAGAQISGRTVVWLDDTPAVRLLGPDGLTAGDLATLLEGEGSAPVVVVYLVWRDAYQRMTAVPQSAKGAMDDPGRGMREALALAVQPPIRVPDDFGEPERRTLLSVANTSGDRRLHDALGDPRYGVAQHLAGAPDLMDLWRGGAAVQPYGAALISAAVDLRALRIREPLTAGLLTAAAPLYLRSEQFAEAPATWFEDGLAYASRQLRGAVRAIFPVPGPEIGTIAGYDVADYLQQHGAIGRDYAAVPVGLWKILAAHVTDLDDLARLGRRAHQLGFVEPARPLLIRVFEHSEDARWRLVSMLVNQQRYDLLREQAAGGCAEAHYALAEYAIEEDRFDDVLEHWRAAETTGLQWWDLAEQLFEREQEDLLRRLYELADPAGEFFYLCLLGYQGRGATIGDLTDAGDENAQFELARLLESLGRVDEALGEYEALFDSEEGDLADESVRAWGHLLAEDGREAELRAWADEGPDSGALLFLAELLARQERLDELRDLAAGGEVTVVWQYTALLRRLNREKELRGLVRRGCPEASKDLANLLLAAGREDDLRAMAAAGNRPARECLIELWGSLGREDELRELVVTGDGRAHNQLLQLLARLGRHEELRRLAMTGDILASGHNPGKNYSMEFTDLI
ncbi:hypothetical protein [Micromonospora sp. D75]|uniref:hypothetical protein n=1 Tax=Micromonospora sp. D75 TaxID=2824885 RepID=UPI001B3737A4|nr:hypothetical protein [Micromonospora sp. D75]MBQ1065213.1 hypothetical protein [Micromonospora sp. D75]